MIQRSLLRQSRALSSKLPRTLTALPSRYSASPLRIPAISTSRSLLPKWYSTTPEPKTDAGEASAAESSEVTSGKDAVETPEDPLKKELETKNREIIDLKDKYLRSVADFRNLQDRTKRDVAAARDFAITRFAKDLIDSVDNLDRALDTVAPEKLSVSDAELSDEIKDLKNLYDGLKMTERIMMETLKKHGLERFDPNEKGEKFDPNLHEAMFMTKMEGKEEGSVFVTQQKGFRLNGRVIRAAKVGVVKNS
ncbi:Mitochondrial matrix cochaperone [Trapelia coarctata]|nr:Mitochondrial matrix cochaperone [Trapelia coarctata]